MRLDRLLRRSDDPHPAAWWVWALAIAAAVSATTNPVLIGLAVATVCLVVVSRRSDAPWALSFRLYLSLAAVVVVLRVVFRVVFGGAYLAPGDHVLLDLPSIPLPDWAAGVSLLGPVTLESLQAGFADGLRLGAIIVCVGAANTLADPRRLLAGLPPALYEVGAAIVIALSMFPQLAESVQRVRKARALRGDPGRGIAALRGVLVPVLEDAFDRSMHLAASMDARGYGRQGHRSVAARRVNGAMLLLGLLGLGVGAYGLLDSAAPRILAMPMLALGVTCSIVGVVLAGRGVRRTRYRPDRWTLASGVLAASGVACAVAVRLVRDPDVLNPLPGSLPPVTYASVAAVLVPLAALTVTRAPAGIRVPPGADGPHQGEGAEVRRDRVA